MELYKKAAKKYKPDKIKVLFIAESPPSNPEAYIYFDQGDYPKTELTYHLFDALGIKQNTDKREIGLKEFIKKGYFLIDAIENPIFKNKKLINKSKQIQDNKARIKSEIKELNPENMVIIGCGVYDVVSKFLDDARLVKKRIPFPSQGHQKSFKNILKQVVKEI